MSENESPSRPRQIPLSAWVYRHRLPILGGLTALLLTGVLVLAHFTSRVTSRFDGRRWNLPSRIYSDLYVLRAGEGGSADGLVAKLERLFYREVAGGPERRAIFRGTRTPSRFTRADFATRAARSRPSGSG